MAIFSYLDTLNFGITGDAETTPDLELLATRVADGLADLKKAAERA